MSDFEQDIIRRVRIETQVDTDTIKKSSATLDNFYKKYQSKNMKVDTSDFFQAVDAVRSLRKELETTKKNAPNMEGIIGQMSTELDKVEQQFERTIVHFTNGDIANGLNEAVDKIASGLSIQSVDLGDYLTSVEQRARYAVDSLKEIGALSSHNNHKYIEFDNLDISQMNQAISLIQELFDAQKELDEFNGKPLKSEDFYSDYQTQALLTTLKNIKNELQIIEDLGLNNEQLFERRKMINNSPGGIGFDSDHFKDLKNQSLDDEDTYDWAQTYLKEQISEAEDFFNKIKLNSYLFTNDEVSSFTKDLTYEINQAKAQLQELQQLGGKNADPIIGGNFSELTQVLEEIKASLKTISDVFKNESNAMSDMVNGEISSFTTWSEAIIAVYNNLNQLSGLVDTISQKDFNVTNITQTNSGNGNIQAMTQQMAVARETMEHLRQLYDQAGETLTLLSQRGQVGLVFEYSKQLQELDMTNINKSIKGANTEMKLASVVAEMQDYIDKLKQINELRNKYNLGEWKDNFVPTHKPISKPTVKSKSQIEPQVAETPNVVRPQNTSVVTNTESQQMWQLKAAIDEVSNAIGRKNAGFIKEQEIVNTSVETEKNKLRELIDVITSEIGSALDNIKAKFAQSFVVPELDKNGLQASFDEIYNKFIELKDKISTMQIDIDIDTANITKAIQEALYAKEIAQKYRRVEFDDIYKTELDSMGFPTLDDEWISQLTGEVLNFRDAQKDFDLYFKDKWVNKDEPLHEVPLNIEEVINKLVHQTNSDMQSLPNQENWAQVIIEAINTQGDNIVQSIKLLIPKNIADNTDDSKLIAAFNTLVESIDTSYIQDFFESVINGRFIPGDDLEDAFKTLGLMSKNGAITFDIPYNMGSINTGTVIGKDFVVSAQPNETYGVPDIADLMEKQNRAYELGAAVPRIIAGVEDPDFETVFQLQTIAPGKNHRTVQDDMYQASDEQIDRLLYTFEKLLEVGLYPEFGGDNVMYDPEKGFTVIDLDLQDRHDDGLDTEEGMVKRFLKSAKIGNYGTEDYKEFERRVIGRFKLPSHERLVNSSTIATEKTQQIQQSSNVNAKITPTMDEGAIAKLVDENVAKTPATVKITPVIDDGKLQDIENYDVNDLAEKYINIAKQSNPASKVAELLNENPLLDGFNDAIGELLTKDGMFKRMQNANDEEINAFKKHLNNYVNGMGDDIFIGGYASDARIEAQKSVDAARASQQAVNAESQSATDAAKQFVEAANAKREFVEANKLVAESAKESASAIKQESEVIDSIDVEISDSSSTDHEAESHKKNTEAIREEILANKDLAKIKDVYDKDDKLKKHEDVYKYKQNNAIITEKVSDYIMTDKNGDTVHSIITTIIKDFEAFNKEEKKTEEAVARAQGKLDEFIKKFKSKTGGNAQFVDGFNELSKFTINKGNIEEAFNLMTKLQAKYNELEGNFRKGQASLNPFTNAINKASNIDNIFGDIEYKFGTLINASETLTNNFKRLEDLSRIIKDFVGIINDNPDSITPDMFSDFSKQVGEFNLLKTQVEGGIKKEGRAEAQDIKKQAKIYAEILRLVKEKNKALLVAAKTESGSVEQKNALMDVWKIQQQLNFLGKQTVLTEEQKIKLGQLREEQARKIRDIEVSQQNQNNVKKANLLEQQRKKRVQEYIDLLKLQYDYEKRAAKENDGSAMQTFYNEQVNKVKEKILEKDRQLALNQEEKLKLLQLEEEKQRAIEEIVVRKQNKGKKETSPFEKEDKKIQDKYDAGYLNDVTYNDWQRELAEYRNYISGITEADETVIKNKKQTLMQMYDLLTKMSNANKSFFMSGGEILSTDLATDKNEFGNMKDYLNSIFTSLSSDRFQGLETSIVRLQPELGKLFFTVDDGNKNLTQYVIHASQAANATKLFENSVKPTFTALQRFGQILKKDFTGMWHAIIGGTSAYSFIRYMRQGVEAVRELDLALTELKKVTDATEEVYDKFLSTASKTSSEIGSTISAFTQATAEFARLGYDINLSSEMAEAALVYSNVGDGIDSVTAASESIISTMKGFGLATSEAMSIVDKFNEVGNNFAITSVGIGEALTQSASALSAAGNTIDESIGLITAANSVVQNPNTVGTALKTLSLRIRGAKTELEEAGLETENMAETTSSLQKKLLGLTSGKVDIMLDANTFKNTTQILREMSTVWEDMTDIQQAAALELLGGKRQANILAAIIDNFDIVEDTIESSLNSEGSALEENEKVLDSIQGRINLFNNALETMWNHLLDDEWIKILVDGGTELVKLADKLGSLKTILFGILTYYSVFKKDKLDFAELFGIQDGKNGNYELTIGQKGLTKWASDKTQQVKDTIQNRKEKKNLNIGSEILGDPQTEVREYAEAIQNNIDDYVSIDTSKIDGDIDSVQNKLKIARQQLDDAKSRDWDYYKTLGSKSPARDRDNSIAEKQQDVSNLEKQLADLENQKNNTISSAVNATAIDLANIKAQTQEYTSMFDVLSKIKNVKLSMGDEQTAAIKIDEINQAASQGQVALMDYASSLGDSDDALKAYIASLNGEQASLAGFNQFIQTHNAGVKASGIAAKAAAIGHAALNAAISMGISVLISWALSAVTKAINANKELAESVEEAISEYKNATQSLREHYETIDEIRDDYERLAQGVDNLGNNVSLSADEYERYNEIVNQIAEMFPEMIAGYTEEGNAIIGLKGNIEALTEAYEKEAQAARDALLISSNDVFKNFKNNTTKVNVWTGKSKFDELAFFEGLLKDSDNTIKEQFLEDSTIMDDWLENAGIDDTNWFSSRDTFKEAIEADKEQIQAYYRTLKAEVEAESSSVTSVLNAYLEQDFDYRKLSNEAKNIAQSIISTFDTEFYSQFDSATEMEAWVSTNLIQPLQDANNLKEFELVLDLQTKFNNGEVDAKEYQEKMMGFIEILKGLGFDEKIIKYVELVFNTNDVSTQVASAQDLLVDSDDSKAETLTKTDLDIIDKYKSEWKIDENTVYSWDQLQKKIAEVKEEANKTDELGFMDSLKDTQSSLKSLGEAFDSFKDDGIVTVETLSELKETFGELDSFNDFVKVLGNSSSTTEDVQQAISNLASEYLTSKDILSDLTEENEAFVISQLEAFGVSNAEEYIQNMRNIQKAMAEQYGIDLSNYGTVEQMKQAISSELYANIVNINDDAIKDLADQYGVDLSNFATVEQQKTAIALAQAKARANLDRQSAISRAKQSTVVGKDQIEGWFGIDAKSLQGKTYEEIKKEYDSGEYDNNWYKTAAGEWLQDVESASTEELQNATAEADKIYNETIAGLEDAANKINSIDSYVAQYNPQLSFNVDKMSGPGSDSGSDDAFQKAMDYWENRIAANQAKYEQIQNEIDLLEKQGKIAGEEYYQEQAKLENERLKLLKSQKAEAQKYLGTFKEGSEEWWEVASTLNDIEGEIDDVTASLQDLSDAIAQIKWDIFDESHTRFGNLKSQLETVRELVAPNNEEDWFDDEGNWTEKGVAVAGAYIQEIEIDENALKDTQKKLKDFEKGYKGNEKYFKKTYGLDSEQEYYDKRQELIEQEQEYAKNINSNKQAVVDMYEAQIDAVEEYTSKLIDSYNEYIDTVKEALDAERELYEFKKDIAKQTKDIAQIERRIASLSGSDNAADIAERRKLEAELAEAKEGLNDSYYAHSKDALQQALEEEANAYEETMNKFIERLRESLNTALQDMDLFMEGVFNAVITNAPSILEQYQNLGIALDDAIVVPWDEASQEIKDFGGVDGLGVMNAWINEGGIFPTFKTSAENALKSPWDAGKTALGSFKQSVDTEMKNIVKTIESNVSSAKTKLNSLTSAIQDTNKQASSSSNSSNSSSSSKSSYSGSSTNYITGEHVRTLQKILNQFFGAKLTVDGSYGPATTNAVKAMKNTLYKSAGYGTGNIPAKTATNGKYDAETKSMLQTYLNKWNVGSWFRENKLSIPAPMYAKGTLGTKRDEFAITDESWIGEEITLAAGKNGQLQYLKKGSAVMPADISANLVEWGKLNPNMMNIANPSAGINLMTNYVSKPELNLSFDALVKAGTITQEALPAVKELVQQELNKFTKQLNYSMKRIGAN